ncbi:MAG: septal ring lytic transglycosylase RlpA family protein, partial [Candidatus Latescibacteria bacterium]|nr:septal ring lytic transglycosylase RlpA family protein [Candidatus Latescibacterota bacterium]
SEERPSKTTGTPSKKKPRPGTKLRGIASYYADDFHGKMTANGEIFDMNGLTCAPKTLPFNTWLEVKNLANGRSVIVRVNDRGPFIAGRILDLSLGAAKIIDMIGTGIQEVEIEVLP